MLIWRMSCGNLSTKNTSLLFQLFLNITILEWFCQESFGACYLAKYFSAIQRKSIITLLFERVLNIFRLDSEKKQTNMGLFGGKEAALFDREIFAIPSNILKTTSVILSLLKKYFSIVND